MGVLHLAPPLVTLPEPLPVKASLIEHNGPHAPASCQACFPSPGAARERKAQRHTTADIADPQINTSYLVLLLLFLLLLLLLLFAFCSAFQGGYHSGWGPGASQGGGAAAKGCGSRL